MSERENTPVEELIGWEAEINLRTGGVVGWWDRTDDPNLVFHERAEVDDLADWLDGNGARHSITGPASRRTTYLWHNPSRMAMRFTALTIHDALVAAVRAVHEQENDR